MNMLYLSELRMVVSAATLVAGFIVHTLFAIAVYSMATRMRLNQSGPWFVEPWAWAFATLVGGILTVLAFWLIHCSALKPVSAPKSEG